MRLCWCGHGIGLGFGGRLAFFCLTYGEGFGSWFVLVWAVGCRDA